MAKTKTEKMEILNVRQVNKKGNRCYEIKLKEINSAKEHIRYADPVYVLKMRDNMGLNETSELIGKQIDMVV